MGRFSDVVDAWDVVVGRELDDRLSRHDLPLLSQLLSGPAGADLAAEIAHLLGDRAAPFRARRRSVELMGQLDAPGYHRSVVIRDISGSGAKLRIARTGVLDIMQVPDMRLRCRVEASGLSPAGNLDLGLELVRVVEVAHRHVELAYRFRYVPEHQRTLIDHLAALYFIH